MQKELYFTARSRQSRRDVENLAANSTRCEKPTNIMVRSLRSRHDICWFLKHRDEVSTNLGEISVISARWRIPRRDLTNIKNVTNVMARSLQSLRDLGNLGEFLAISARWKISRRDFAEI